MKPSEARRFAEQAERSQRQVEEFREAAGAVADPAQAMLLRTAANAIETTATEWATLASELAKE